MYLVHPVWRNPGLDELKVVTTLWTWGVVWRLGGSAALWLWVHCWRLTLADFVRSDSLTAGEIFGPLNNARFHRFPVGQILLHLNKKTLIGISMKTFGTEYWKFCHKRSLSKKSKKICTVSVLGLFTKFKGLVTSGRHNYTITDRRKFTTKWSPLRDV